MNKLYKVRFLNAPGEHIEIHAKSVGPSDIIGLVDINEIVFIDSSEIILTPEDDKVKKIFKDVTRTMLPINTIVRIDEIVVKKNTSVIQLYKTDNETDN